MAQLPIVIEPTRVELIGLGDEHCVMEPTTGLHYLDISSGEGSIDSWGQLMAEVTLAQLPIVVAAHSVNQMVILVIGILSHNNGMIIAWTDTQYLNIVFDITEYHLWLTNIDLCAVAQLPIIIIAAGVQMALLWDETYGFAPVGRW